MKRFLIPFFAVLVMAMAASAQNQKKTVKSNGDSSDKSYDLAKLAFEAHGGEKLKKMKTLVVIGSVDITTSAITQAIPATFVNIFSGEKYLFELNNPFQPVKQVFDGQQTLSNIRGGFTLPPLTKFGIPLLSKIEEKGYLVSSLSGTESRKKGFRIATPDGDFTDFYLDEKTNQIKSYKAGFEISGRSVTTSVEIDKYKIVDGIYIPEKYAQRFDLGQMTAYAAFKAKEILINSVVSDDKFVLGK